MPRSATRHAKDIRAIVKSLKTLAGHFERFSPLLGEHQDVRINGKVARRRPKLTAKHLAAMKLQGRYMGLLRGLRPRQRSAVKRVRAQKGVRVAIRAARSVAR